MARLTRAQIVDEGQKLSGREDLATNANAWLQRWLDSVAASWPWPMLQREVLAIPVSAATLLLGNGNGGVTEKIQRILDNVWLYDSAKTMRRQLRVKTFLSSPEDRITASLNTGIPSYFRLIETQHGAWTLYFDITPSTTYYLSVPYIALPVAMTSDSDVPWYPNDETMVQAVAFKVAEHSDGKDSEAAVGAQQLLASLVSNDRVRYGAANGVNDLLQLDPVRFRKARTP